MPRTNVHSLTPSPLNVQLTLSGGKVNMSTAPNIIFVRNRFERRMGLDRKKNNTKQNGCVHTSTCLPVEIDVERQKSVLAE